MREKWYSYLIVYWSHSTVASFPRLSTILQAIKRPEKAWEGVAYFPGLVHSLFAYVTTILQ